MINESNNIITEIQLLSKNHKKIVFVSGNFNILHPGHLRLLRFASECGDFLVVGVNPQQTPGAVLDEKHRFDAIQSIGFVDYVFILRERSHSFIKKLRPAVVVKGKEHEFTSNVELDTVLAYGGKLLFGSGDLTFSSMDLLKNEFIELKNSSINLPHDYLLRHNIKMSDLENGLKKINDLSICVVGELIVDEYITCDPIGMSQEDPTIVVSPVLHENFIGGAGIVAAHAKGLGANVSFFSVVGDDENSHWAKEKLSEYNVNCHLYVDSSRPTTHKQRFRASEKTLLRVSHLRSHDINIEIQDRILFDLEKSLLTCDLLIFSDFNYGCLPQSLVDKISKLCDENQVMMVADSQSSSQTGNISRFKDTNLITPTEREARIALRDYKSGLVVLAEALRATSQTGNIVITLGAEGVLIHAPGKDGWYTDRLAGFNTTTKDIAGAGDSMLTCTALALAVNCNIWESIYLGSLASACQVGRIGNIPLTQQDLLVELEQFSNNKSVII